jgi:poly(A) polymerase/tRNA nucleotidyltransferase (CCA-adding enzyme)
LTKRNNDSEVSTYVSALSDAGGELYEVGGPVRDRLMGRASKDHDLLCRHLTMRRISSLLKPYGKVAAVGKSFGVLKFSPHRAKGMEIDIALPRREVSTGVGHRDFDVDYDPELAVEDDLGRRDFTINAMALSLADGEIIDPYGGKSDLKKKILRMVFPRAFDEDPLRLVRAIQFTARFGLTIEKKTWEEMKRCAPLIKTVSGERIGMEIAKLMTAEKPSVGFDLMCECGLMEHILPELIAIKGIEQDKQPGDDVYGHTMRALDAARSDHAIENSGDLEVMFAVLLHDLGKARTARFHPPSKRVVFFGHQVVSARLARHIMGRLKLSTVGIKTQNVNRLIENHMFETKANFTDRAIRRFISKVGKDLIFKLMDMRLADNRGGKHPYGIKGATRLKARIREEIDRKPPFGPGDLAINGNDLMRMGLAEGPAVGITLAMLVERVLDDPGLNTQEQLLALAREIMEDSDKLQEAAAERMKERSAQGSRAPKKDNSPEKTDGKKNRSGKGGRTRIQGRQTP